MKPPAHPVDVSSREQRPTNVRWAIFGLGCGTSWFLYLHRYTFGIIKPEIAEQWHLQEDQLGWLDFAFSITYAVGQVPAGLLSDFLGAHLFLGITITGWAVALSLHALAPTYEWMYPVRVLFGAMQAGCYPTLSKLSKTWFPRHVRTILQGWIASFFGRMGGAMSNVIFATLLIGYFSLTWQSALHILMAAGVLFGVVFIVLYRNSPREHPAVNAAEVRLIEGDELPPVEIPAGGPPPRLTFRAMYAGMSARSLKNFGFFLMQQFTSTFPDMIYSAWIPYFLRTAKEVDPATTGILASLPLFGGAAGGVVGGFLNDFLILKIGRRWGRSLVGFTGKMMAALLIVLALLNYENPTVFCIILFFVKFFADWAQPTVWGTVTDIGGRATATVFGFNNMVGGFGGIVSPVVFGYMAKLSGWTPVFVLVGVMYLLSSICWLFVNCTIPLMQEERLEERMKEEQEE